MPLHTLQIGDKEDSTRCGLSCFVTVTPSATALKARLITDGMSTVTIRLHRRWAADFTILPLQMRCTGATWITSCNRLPRTDCSRIHPTRPKGLDTNFSGERNYSLPAIRSIPR